MNNYFDPLILSKLSNMLLRARFVVEGFFTGLHKSPYHGSSIEFKEHRAYTKGDETRYIDWKFYGRTDRYFIKQFEEETNLRGYILLDASNSMGYAKKGNLSKLTYGSYLTACLAYLMFSQQDSFGLLIFDEEVRSYLPPRSSQAHLSNILGKLENIKPSLGTHIGRISQKLAEVTKRRGLIILISDLFDEKEEMIKTLRYFRGKKHEVILFHLLDAEEIELAFSGSVLFEDSETGERLLTQPETISARYNQLIREFTCDYKNECLNLNIDYFLINTATPLDKALISYFTKRKAILAK